MNAVTTSIAKAKYDAEKHQVIIIFDGIANPETFQESLDIILEIGLINRTNQWIINLNNLNGLSTPFMLKIILSWIENGYEKMISYGVKDQAEILIVDPAQFHALADSLKKLEQQKLIPEWIRLNIFKEKASIKVAPKIKNKEEYYMH